jgi:hypothetical protein
LNIRYYSGIREEVDIYDAEREKRREESEGRGGVKY